MRQTINAQLRNLTINLVRLGLAIDQNWPVFKSSERVIRWQNFKNIAFTLKDEPYEKVYEECKKNRDYNFLLLDGAMIQMLYKFDNRDNLIGHILSFYPHYDFARFQDFPDEYEELFYGTKHFTDILEGKAITFPLRFDFSQEHTEFIHPMVHATLGNYRDCRIPISKPVSPYRFISFILRNFYSVKFYNLNLSEEFEDNLTFDDTITENEKGLLHFTYE